MWEKIAGGGGGWGIGSAMATAMFLWVTIRPLFPNVDFDPRPWFEKLVAKFYPYVDITFTEYRDGRFKRNPAFAAISSYLSASCSTSARRLLAELNKNSSHFVLTLDNDEQVVDTFNGAQFWWRSSTSKPNATEFSFFRAPPKERRYVLTFHRRHRRLAEENYLGYVMARGKEMEAQRRQRRLFTNDSSLDWGSPWRHVAFDHPAKFETLAMDPAKKEELVQDLLAFRENKEYYARLGKVWKRGYLLYGPPGTGKSSTIAAMANLLEYDIYDLELTAVKDNAALRKLLIETTAKSIIVVEDIDCSLNVTSGLSGPRQLNGDDEMSKMMREALEGDEGEASRVTLSGLLNFIDGLWSASPGERIIVFTTNHVEKLHPALIRRGRMDVHVELSYCRFEAFKVLARSYLGVVDHAAFADVRRLIEEVNITPADVAELFMRGKAEDCLRALVAELEERRAAPAKDKTTEIEAGED
ncbi:AAA-ATPase At3g28580-like [Wolffia australiana]